MNDDRSAANGPWQAQGPPGEGVSPDIETLEIRLAKAQASAERLRRGGTHESYLEAVFLVEALELQLQQAMAARPLHPAGST